jgi:glycosyltransferase involved in cell wall biosynthesis
MTAVNQAPRPVDEARPRVLHVLTRLEGGPPVMVIPLLRELNRLGYNARLLTGRCEDPSLDMSYLLTPDDPIQWIPEMSRSVSVKNDVIALWRLYRLMRAAKPVIVQTHTAKAGLLGRIAAWLARVPVVIHTFHGHSMTGYFASHVNLAMRFAERTLAKITDAVLVLSPQQQQDLVERFHVVPRRKIHVIPLGLDLDRYQKLAPPTGTEGWLTVGWAGRFVPIKDVALLIEVMRETFVANARIRFIIAGIGPQRDLMEEAVRLWPDERLEWLGWTSDMEGFISRCDVLIQTSRNEGTPVGLIQGMAAGRPFVSTPAGGVVDMVTGAGTREPAGGEWFANGVLVEPNARIFASVLCQMQRDRRRLNLMGREAAVFALGRFNLGELARNYERLYAGLLGKGVKAEEPAVVARVNETV